MAEGPDAAAPEGGMAQEPAPPITEAAAPEPEAAAAAPMEGDAEPASADPAAAAAGDEVPNMSPPPSMPAGDELVAAPSPGAGDAAPQMYGEMPAPGTDASMPDAQQQPQPAMPPPLPEKDPDEDVLPFDHDVDAWLDLLRDGYVRQLREDNEYLEPPPFHRAMHYAAPLAPPGSSVPPGRYPRQALDKQLALLLKLRYGETSPDKGAGKGGPGWRPPMGKGGNPMAALAAAAALQGLQGNAAALLQGLAGQGIGLQGLQGLALQGLQGMQGMRGPGVVLPPQLQQGNLLLEAAKALAGKGGASMGTKGVRKGASKGKFQGVQRTIGK
mmetsp:Transcript_22547/g.49848  ORF Transcript_22547/g.49848 Transcript_22547/m.49848 type:complete len:328 (-) Transcript_22547:109-1092(-)